MLEAKLDRRTFIATGVTTTALGVTGVSTAEAEDNPKRIRIAIIGCGSVSDKYLPHLSKSPHVELVSTCDRIPERAKAQAERFAIPNQYPHIDALLGGAAFDLLVNLTDMQEHERLNRQTVEAGKHVWSASCARNNPSNARITRHCPASSLANDVPLAHCFMTTGRGRQTI